MAGDMNDVPVQMLDTQILSYAYKNVPGFSASGAHISSVAAKEFLRLQEKQHTSASYYLPVPAPRFQFEIYRYTAEKRPFSKIVTDQILLDFGNDFPTIVEYSHLALAETINVRAKELFHHAIFQLDKEEQKKLRRQFGFLLSNGVKCVPLSTRAVKLGLELFARFIERYATKPDFRNTVNDTLILASAIDSAAQLITNDSLLTRFAVEQFGGTMHLKGNVAAADFRRNNSEYNLRKHESKGYVNRGWSYRIRRRN